MKDYQNLHLKVQELCDCFATTDPLREMSLIKNEQDKEEAALKWLSLVALHGINENAKKISITRSNSGNVNVEAEYRKKELPSPGDVVAKRIMNAVKEIAHFDENQGEMPLSLGIRDSSVGIGLKMKTKNNKMVVTIKFPNNLK